jgi:hypothetical protein
MFGGNSNWRGPIWMPVNVMLIRALLNFYAYYGDTFKIECPTGSGTMMNLFEVAKEIADRLARIFLRDDSGRRPVYGGAEKFQSDPHWRDLILFYEYFHGDNGAGLGASHQTGWTGVVAKLIQLFGLLDAGKLLERQGPPSHLERPRSLTPLHRAPTPCDGAPGDRSPRAAGGLRRRRPLPCLFGGQGFPAAHPVRVASCSTQGRGPRRSRLPTARSASRCTPSPSGNQPRHAFSTWSA